MAFGRKTNIRSFFGYRCTVFPSRSVLLVLSRRSALSLPVLWLVLPPPPPYPSTYHLTHILIEQGTTDVRVDPQLNKKVWEAGVKGVPYRLRVRISRKRNDEEGAKEKLYSYVQAVNVKDVKGLHTAVVDEE